MVFSYLPRVSLVLTALVNRCFQIQSEYLLYRSVKLINVAQIRSYQAAIRSNNRRRLRLVDLHTQGNGSSHIIQLLLGNPEPQSAFENLIDLVYLPGGFEVSPFKSLIKAYKQNPSIKLPKLQRLVGYRDVDKDFFTLLRMQSSITSFDVIRDLLLVRVGAIWECFLISRNLHAI